MGDSFLAGVEIADRLHSLERRCDALDTQLATYILEHETNAGAHAAAFAAHGLSPGPVEEAEEVATETLEGATDTLEAAATALAITADETAATLADAAAELVEGAAETAETPLEMIDEGAGENEPEPEPEDPIREREPSREHPLHRKFGQRSE